VVLFRHFLRGLRKIREVLSISTDEAEIRTEHLPNTILKRYVMFLFSKLLLVIIITIDRFCGLMVRVPEVPGSIPGATRFSEK
jgi:hypothetical protein